MPIDKLSVVLKRIFENSMSDLDLRH